MHALLRLYFDDIRPEEWVPSYAGALSRTDFLLPQIDTVIETKKTRSGLNAKTVGEQLIIDIARYKKHPQCRRLVCFVYDPEGRIANPSGIESDLNSGSHGIEVRVLILPKASG
ncbi:REase [compost metagenome]